MKKPRLLGAVCACLFALNVTAPTNAALIGRDLDGNTTTAEAYYDTALNITWLADANAGAGSTFDDIASNDGTMTDGQMTWINANSWASSLDINGITGWRLPTLSALDGVSFDTIAAKDGSADVGYNMSAPATVYAGSTASEMAHLFYNTLGNLAIFDTEGNNFQPGWGLTNSGPFTNIQTLTYWSLVPNITNDAWSFRVPDRGSVNPPPLGGG